MNGEKENGKRDREKLEQEPVPWKVCAIGLHPHQCSVELEVAPNNGTI
jgi:hypothetical protein